MSKPLNNKNEEKHRESIPHNTITKILVVDFKENESPVVNFHDSTNLPMEMFVNNKENSNQTTQQKNKTKKKKPLTWTIWP